MADVARACERRSPKDQGLLRMEGPPTYAILSRNSVLLRFGRISQGFERKSPCFRRAFNKSHPAFVELTTKAILLSKSLQRKPSCFQRKAKTTNIYAIVKNGILSQKFANMCSTKALRDYLPDNHCLPGEWTIRIYQSLKMQ